MSIIVKTITFLENLLLSLFFYFLVSIVVKNFRIKQLKKFRKKVSYIYTYKWMDTQIIMNS